MGRFLDWLTDRVQAESGEKERRQLVQELKAAAYTFKGTIEKAISQLNVVIEKFNAAIKNLNQRRQGRTKQNIETLHVFLSKFGQCKDAGAFAPESERLPDDFPQRRLDSIENYIAGVDWSSDEVFMNTIFRTPLGMKLKTRKQNLSLRERLNELKLETEATKRDLELREYHTEQDIQICELYSANVDWIAMCITRKVLPELELIEAFFGAEALKDTIIANGNVRSTHFVYDIKSIKDTRYDRHYQFIKNAFMFYVISCRIYNTPVLTRLLANQATSEDAARLLKEKELLENQTTALDESMLLVRR